MMFSNNRALGVQEIGLFNNIYPQIHWGLSKVRMGLGSHGMNAMLTKISLCSDKRHLNSFASSSFFCVLIWEIDKTRLWKALFSVYVCARICTCTYAHIHMHMHMRAWACTHSLMLRLRTLTVRGQCSTTEPHSPSHPRHWGKFFAFWKTAGPVNFCKHF